MLSYGVVQISEHLDPDRVDRENKIHVLLGQLLTRPRYGKEQKDIVLWKPNKRQKQNSKKTSKLSLDKKRNQAYMFRKRTSISVSSYPHIIKTTTKQPFLFFINHSKPAALTQNSAPFWPN
ncbi:unnamed protein product [Periconia digitata]|uniref:Uncharacterized protein n=1 Tax=Periconia digitata TaxID=1303443 RepID=A0A9W4UWN4_9PLEO|nr:unnamed protein product [Periconia digitata]